MSDMHPVLIVHEDQGVRQRLCNALARLGYPALTSSSMSEALSVMKHEWPSLILAGAHLTDTTGAELARRIRSFNERVPIVMLGNGQATMSSLLQTPEVQAAIPEEIPEEQLRQEIDHWLRVPAPKPRVRWPGVILVVDDEPKLRKVLQEFLQAHGFAVVSAESGEAALEVLAASHPSVVLLDVNLPGMDGLSTLKRIKAVSPGTTVLMITGIEKEDTMGHALSLGANDYILKPFNLEYLQTVLLSKIVLGRAP